MWSAIRSSRHCYCHELLYWSSFAEATEDILRSSERRMVDLRGVEPLTSAMRMQRSSQTELQAHDLL